MTIDIPSDVARLIAEQMRCGGYASEQDVLRDALQALADRSADESAIAAGIADMEAGRTVDAHEAEAVLRNQLGFPGAS